MKNIKELLELMLEHQDKFHSGLCHWNLSLFLNQLIIREEYEELRTYIRKNRPSIFSSFDAFKHYGDAFYWTQYKIEPRIEWIHKHIKLNS